MGNRIITQRKPSTEGRSRSKSIKVSDELDRQIRDLSRVSEGARSPN